MENKTEDLMDFEKTWRKPGENLAEPNSTLIAEFG